MDQIEEIKQKVDIVSLVGSYVTLKKAGRNFKGLCPFHGEKSPSFMVSPELSIYKCFGCSKGGDVFGFLQEIEGVEFGEALRILAEKAGIKLQSKYENQDDIKSQLIKTQELAAEYYHFLLTKHPVGKAPLAYLHERKINDKLIEQFRIGYALPSWDGLVKFLSGKKKIDKKILEKTGLMIKGDKGDYDRFRGRIIFPLLDGRGRVIAFAGRVIPGMEEMKDSPKYINSPETEIYHKSQTLYGLFQGKQAIRTADRVVITEGEIDMISSFAAGVSETVAIKGSALTQEQIEILGRLTKNFVLALDADEAGQEAMKRGINLAENEGINVKVVQIRGGKDPDEIARNNSLEWKKLIDNAVDVYEFYIQSGLKRFDVNTVEGKRRFGTEVLPVINRITNQVVRSFYVRRVASLLGVDEESIVREMARMGKMIDVRSKMIEEPKIETDQLSRQEKLENELLSLVFAGGTGVSLTWASQLVKDEVGGVVGKVLDRWHKNNDKMPVAEFINALPEELQPAAQTAFLKEIDLRDIGHEFAEARREWVKLIAKKRITELSEKIRVAEDGKSEDLPELQRKFVEWTKALSIANNEG